MAAQSNLKNMTLALGAVCLVCSALLRVAYAVTKAPIEKAAQAKTEASLSQVLPAFDAIEESTVAVEGKDVHYYKALSEGKVVGYAVEAGTIGFGGPLTLMVGVTPDGVVYNTSVLSHSETPGLGAKCATDTKFMQQWQGFNPGEKILSVKKDGGDVDAITASTITSRAYTRAVALAVAAAEAAAAGEAADAVSGASLPQTEEGEQDNE